jgi:hypothetical protein
MLPTVGWTINSLLQKSSLSIFTKPEMSYKLSIMLLFEKQQYTLAKSLQKSLKHELIETQPTPEKQFDVPLVAINLSLSSDKLKTNVDMHWKWKD